MPLAFDGRELFLTHLDTIDRAIEIACKRWRMDREDRDDLASSVRLKLIDNDYAVLAKFQGRSSFRTYVVVVIERLLVDQWIAQNGKWHPSAAARRLGSTAMLLERLLEHDGYSLDECWELLRTNHGLALTQDELREIAAALPKRERRKREDEAVLERLVAAGPTAEEELLEREESGPWLLAEEALRNALAALPAEDRLLLHLRFEAGLTVARIAATLQIEQKALYRRLNKLLKLLRKDLARRLPKQAEQRLAAPCP
jgi:RNA polymerase sigma factor (sigma-70 family)